MSDQITIIYYIVLVLLSIFVIILSIRLYMFCKKKPIKAEETLLTKIPACSYTLIDIDAATDGFNHRRIIGKGRLGTLYVAVMPDGDVTAVKRIHPRLVLNHAGFGFSSTLKWLSSADHPNVLPILGFCEAPGERIVVMEFNGMLGLDFYLNQNFGDGGGAAAVLDWNRRVRIAAGAARGIEYLHEVMSPNIIHGCVKPSNILIDVNFCSKVCDYGLHFLAPLENHQGLVGYVDDEYWVGNNGKRGASKESDVYGFGVVLLELLSGRRRNEQQQQKGLNIVEWGLPLIKEMKLSEFLDDRLVMPCDVEPLVRMARLALACVGNTRSNRPSIVQVAAILNNLEMELCL